MRLTGFDPGFRVAHLLTARVALPEDYKTPEQVAGFYRQFMARMTAVPGVKGIAMTDAAPLSQRYGSTRFAVDGEPTPEAGRFPVGDAMGDSPNYFELMGIPVLAGRGFTDRDVRTDDAEPVIVNEALARKFYQGNAVGQNMILGVLTPKPSRHPIIGGGGGYSRTGDEQAGGADHLFRKLRRFRALRGGADPHDRRPDGDGGNNAARIGPSRCAGSGERVADDGGDCR